MKNVITILAFAVFLPAGFTTANSAGDGRTPPDQGYRRLFAEKGSIGQSRHLRSSGAFETRFDVQHYVIDIAIDPQLHFISGTVTARILVTGLPLDSLLLHLGDNMNVDELMLGANAIPFARSGDRICFAADGAVGDTVSVRIRYNGYPVDQGLRFRSESIYTVSEPDMARNWFPCYDEPWDKATCEMIVTVPDTLYCASNGSLVSTVDNLDGTATYHWKTRYPLATYSASIAVARYEIVPQWYRYGEADSMPMPNYVFSDKSAPAQITLSHVPAMMEYFADRFGEYPFLDEKYGTALVQMNGAMENFTCTSLDRRRVDGTLDHDWVLAHELGHSWFGNSVTMRDWPDIWINEGFATYCDALWAEQSGGSGACRDRMAFFKSEYFIEDASSRFSTYDPEFLWGATVYEKGAWVLHMLRYLLGDSDFFESLRQYHAQYRYGSATTEQFKSVCESVSSRTLGSFFDEWIYQAGYPEYRLSWWCESAGGAFDVTLRVRQLQQNAPLFTIPVAVRITTAAGDTTIEIVPHSADEQFHASLRAEPLNVRFDPDEWILKTVEEVPNSAESARPAVGLLVDASPNPGDGRAVRFDFYLPKPELVSLEIFDVVGRRIDVAVRERRDAFWNTAYWNPDSRAGSGKRSGVFFYRLRAGAGTAAGKVTIIR